MNRNFWKEKAKMWLDENKTKMAFHRRKNICKATLGLSKMLHIDLFWANSALDGVPVTTECNNLKTIILNQPSENFYSYCCETAHSICLLVYHS